MRGERKERKKPEKEGKRLTDMKKETERKERKTERKGGRVTMRGEGGRGRRRGER